MLSAHVSHVHMHMHALTVATHLNFFLDDALHAVSQGLHTPTIVSTHAKHTSHISMQRIDL